MLDFCEDVRPQVSRDVFDCLFASIVTSSVRLHVESGQDVLETVPQEHISSALEWSDCGSNTYIMNVSSVSIDPDPPVR